MTVYLDPLDDDAIKTIGTAIAEPPLRLRDLAPQNPDVKTYGIGPRTIGNTENSIDSIGHFPEITAPPSGATKVAQAAHEAGIADLSPAKSSFQNLAFEAVKAGLAREKFGSDKLHRHSAEIKQHLKNIIDSIGHLPEITAPPSGATKVAQAAHEAGIADLSPAKSSFQNLAFEAVKAGLAREKFGSDKLHRHSAEIKQHLKNIDDLLDLSAELTALGEKESHDISPKMKGMIDQLKENGIDVWPGGGNKISKDKLGEMKSLVSSQVDKSRTKLQTTITVDIQPEINNLNSIMNVIQQMIQSDARLKKHANDNSTK